MNPKWHIAFCNMTITKYAGITYKNYYNSSQNMLEAQLKAKDFVERNFGVGKFIVPYIDSPCCILSSFLGMNLIFPSEDELPYLETSKPLINSPEDIEKLTIPDYKTSGFMAKRWETWNYYVSQGYKVRFWSTHGSVIQTACEITNDNIFWYLVEIPEEALKILDFIVKINIWKILTKIFVVKI